MNNLLVRALTGAVFVIVVLGAVWYGKYTAAALFGLIVVLGLIEFFGLFRNHPEAEVSSLIGTIAGSLIFGLHLCAIFGWIPQPALFLVFPFLFLLSLTELWRKKSRPLLNLGILFFGLFYLITPFFLMADLAARSTHSEPLLIGMFLLIWSNDTFAYLSGRAFGRTKLFERISPKKTWEGTIGGILLTILAGWLIGTYLSPNTGIFFWMTAAAIVAPCAIFGDLLESLFKRSLNIKDSGNILPGHGGILDRFDAAIFATPFFYCWWMINAYF